MGRHSVTGAERLNIAEIDLLDSDRSQGVDEKYCRELAPAELVRNRGPTWTAGRDFAIENGRNAGG
jgi:hypothetical protein